MIENIRVRQGDGLRRSLSLFLALLLIVGTVMVGTVSARAEGNNEISCYDNIRNYINNTSWTNRGNRAYSLYFPTALLQMPLRTRYAEFLNFVKACDDAFCSGSGPNFSGMPVQKLKAYEGALFGFGSHVFVDESFLPCSVYDETILDIVSSGDYPSIDSNGVLTTWDTTIFRNGHTVTALSYEYFDTFLSSVVDGSDGAPFSTYVVPIVASSDFDHLDIDYTFDGFLNLNEWIVSQDDLLADVFETFETEYSCFPCVLVSVLDSEKVSSRMKFDEFQATLTSYVNGLSDNVITESGNTGDSIVTLDYEPATFDVTIPTVLPVSVDSDNNITVADNAQIINNSKGAVRVTSAQFETVDNWELVDFDTDFTKIPVDSKQYGFFLQGNKVNTNGVLDVENCFDTINGGSSISLAYNANVAIQSTAHADVDIGKVVFTVDWYTAA